MENDLILRIGNDNYSYLCGLRKSFIVPGAGEAGGEVRGPLPCYSKAVWERLWGNLVRE